jgi:ABC-type uncharacterized transport system substrate-binding protein
MYRDVSDVSHAKGDHAAQFLCGSDRFNFLRNPNGRSKQRLGRAQNRGNHLDRAAPGFGRRDQRHSETAHRIRVCRRTDLAITYENAQGNPATAARIAQRYVANPPDLIIAISTPSAQAVAAAINDIPIIFSAVTDPVAAGLVASLELPGGNVTGVSDHTRASDTLALIGEITTGARRLGFLFNPNESNSIATRMAFLAAAKSAGIIIVDAAVLGPTEVAPATRSLVGQVDAIFAPTDNTVVQDFEAAAAVAIEAKLPLYAADPENVTRGALAALGVDYQQIGTLTAELADRVLRARTLETSQLYSRLASIFT